MASSAVCAPHSCPLSPAPPSLIEVTKGAAPRWCAIRHRAPQKRAAGLMLWNGAPHIEQVQVCCLAQRMRVVLWVAAVLVLRVAPRLVGRVVRVIL